MSRFEEIASADEANGWKLKFFTMNSVAVEEVGK